MLEAVPERGLLMGNRGILHDAAGQISSTTWKHKAWVCCLTSFKDRHRSPMPPGRYTALFFLDEAVALAAGHRPCCECRRQDYQAFITAWRLAEGLDAACPVGAKDIDAALHVARLDDAKRQKRFHARLDNLPDGSFVVTPGEPMSASLLWREALHRWSHGGYRGMAAVDKAIEVDVITPLPTVGVLRAGYLPGIHSSVRAAAVDFPASTA